MSHFWMKNRPLKGSNGGTFMGSLVGNRSGQNYCRLDNGQEFPYDWMGAERDSYPEAEAPGDIIYLGEGVWSRVEKH